MYLMRDRSLLDDHVFNGGQEIVKPIATNFFSVDF